MPKFKRLALNCTLAGILAGTGNFFPIVKADDTTPRPILRDPVDLCSKNDDPDEIEGVNFACSRDRKITFYVRVPFRKMPKYYGDIKQALGMNPWIYDANTQSGTKIEPLLMDCRKVFFSIDDTRVYMNCFMDWRHEIINGIDKYYSIPNSEYLLYFDFAVNDFKIFGNARISGLTQSPDRKYLATTQISKTGTLWAVVFEDHVASDPTKFKAERLNEPYADQLSFNASGTEISLNTYAGAVDVLKYRTIVFNELGCGYGAESITDIFHLLPSQFVRTVTLSIP
jgi:hypothetical protein